MTISIIMGSDSDLPIMQAGISICEQFGVAHEVEIISAHRTPDRLYEYSHQAYDRGIKIIIAGAGGAAHLPGMVAALTTLPVIGVPISTKHLQGVDSLYSIVQMPKGIPVATVAIGNAENAALLAIQILGVFEPDLWQKLQMYRTDLKQQVLSKQIQLESMGYRAYLSR
jgi:5-(carboxyamino)imidazole ribonucleotide mutase